MPRLALYEVTLSEESLDAIEHALIEACVETYGFAYVAALDKALLELSRARIAYNHISPAKER